jgi:hypothetical protein
VVAIQGHKSDVCLHNVSFCIVVQPCEYNGKLFKSSRCIKTECANLQSSNLRSDEAAMIARNRWCDDSLARCGVEGYGKGDEHTLTIHFEDAISFALIEDYETVESDWCTSGMMEVQLVIVVWWGGTLTMSTRSYAETPICWGLWMGNLRLSRLTRRYLESRESCSRQAQRRNGEWLDLNEGCE